MESEVTPTLPTSGQILGVLVKAMGLREPRLRSKTAMRYFSGRQESLVKESSRSEVIEAISDALAELGFEPTSPTGEVFPASVLAHSLDGQAVRWDRIRNYILPRMSRVYPGHLDTVRMAYLRLAAIDIALRVAAHLHLTETSPSALDFLDWIGDSRRGAFLNEKRKNGRVPLLGFAEAVGVTDSTVEGWVYHGARPSDENIAKIGKALAPDCDLHECDRIVRNLRLLYWVSDIAGILGNHVGAEAVEDLVDHLRRYSSQAYLAIDELPAADPSPNNLVELATAGASAPLAQPLLAILANHESDDEWKEYLLSAGSDWVGRVLRANLQVHQAEVDALIVETDGRILENWEVRNPIAYEHYQKSIELQMQGRTNEALSEVARAVELDPLDPANHFTMGSAKGHVGSRTGDEDLVKEGLEACWIAAKLAPDWILPWAEIGWILVESGRAREAVEHLRAVRPDRGPLDSRYYGALGVALRAEGHYADSLAAFESALELNPDDMPAAIAAAGVALLAGDKIRSNRHRKVARHLGATNELDWHLKMVDALKTEFPPLFINNDQDRGITELNVAIWNTPGNASARLARGMVYFRKGDDYRAISDLDAAIRIDPSNASAHLIRGIVYGYMERHDLVIADMTNAIRLKPDDSKAHYYRGLAHGEQDSLDLAITDLSEAIRLDPDLADAYQARGDCHRYKKEYESAIEDYDAAVRLDPEDASAYRGRGASYRRIGRLELAVAEYDVAIQLDPEDPFAHRFRGDAYLAKGDYGEAVADFSASLRLNPDDEVAHRGRGNAHLLSGELDLALADFDAAIECDPESALATYGRGVVRQVMGDTLTADTSGISDANGLTGVSYAYQWIRNDGGSDSNISGATGQTYTLTNDDSAKAIKVSVTFTDDDGYTATLTSAATGIVAAPPNQAPTGVPTITGTAIVGDTLTADTTGISDANGLTGVSYAYQWIRNDGRSDSNISGATGQTYTLTDDDQGNTIKVRVSFTDDDGYLESLTSAATGSVAAITLINPPAETPTYLPQGSSSPAPSVSEPAGDDLPNLNSTTGRVVVGDSGATGYLSANDIDAFKVDLEAGKRYRIDVPGSGIRDHATGGTYPGKLELQVRMLDGTVGDKLKRLNGFGEKAPAPSSDNNAVNVAGGPDNGGRSEFDVTQTNTYLIKVVSDGSNTGTYTVKASEITSEQAFGDFTSQWNSGRVKINDTDAMTGNIEDSTDSDWFMASLEAGKCYSIQVRGQHSNADHDGGTLRDPKLKVANFFDYYEKRFYDLDTHDYVGVPANQQDVAYYDETFINPSNFVLLNNRADKICNMVRPHGESNYKLVCNYYCDDNSGPGNNSLIKVRVNSGGEGEYVIGVEGQGSTGTYSVFVKEIDCP